MSAQLTVMIVDAIKVSIMRMNVPFRVGLLASYNMRFAVFIFHLGKKVIYKILLSIGYMVGIA